MSEARRLPTRDELLAAGTVVPTAREVITERTAWRRRKMQEARDAGWRTGEIAEAFGVSRYTVYNMTRYRNDEVMDR